MLERALCSSMSVCGFCCCAQEVVAAKKSKCAPKLRRICFIDPPKRIYEAYVVLDKGQAVDSQLQLVIG
jgi:hypothetical protein